MPRLTDEQQRHRCEVRQVLRWRQEHGREWVFKWLDALEAEFSRGAQLRFDAIEQWNLGNRGADGDWRYLPGGSARLFG